MARVLPDLPRHKPLNTGEYAELQLLRRLADEVPDAFTLFHGVQMGHAGGPTPYGELDLILLNQAGDLLLIELKCGPIEIQNGQCIKRYGTYRKDVLQQARRQLQGLRQRLQDEGLSVEVHHALVLPDVRVLSGSVAWPREWILDSDAQKDLSQRLVDRMGGPGVPKVELHRRLVDFLSDRFRVVEDVSARTQRVQQLTQRLAEGLATWVPRLQVPSGLLRIQATAGSGKTQLALRLMQDAVRHGKRAAYLCFNRPLSEHMARLAPVACQVETFHELAVRRHRHQLGRPDWQPSSSEDFRAAESTLLEQLEAAVPDLDLLILDEAQDFHAEWVRSLLGRLRSEGQGFLLEDPDQALYADREPFELPDAATLRSPENFRSPHALIDLINLLRLTKRPVEARGVEIGGPPEPLGYETPRQLLRQTEVAVQRCLDRGYPLRDIVVLSYRGRANSHLHSLERLGDWTLQRPTDRYDDGGSMQWTSGELMLDTVYRFKGQSAPAVVLTECDFTQMDPLTKRRLFVGFTRAQAHLEWVLSTAAERAVTEALA